MTNWIFYTTQKLQSDHPDAFEAIRAEATRHGLPFDELTNDSMYQTDKDSPLYVSFVHVEQGAELIVTYDFKKKRAVDSVLGPYIADVDEGE